MSEVASSSAQVPVLIIEDAVDQRRVLVDILENEGFAPLACGTARETLEILQRKTIAVAILDLRLPDVSGTELLGRIRAMDPRLRIIVYTGHGSFSSAVDAVNLGAFGYVRKPGDPEQLLRLIHRAAQGWMKEELQESQERYRTLAEVAPVGIFRSTADGVCHYVNEQWKQMTGLTLADVDSVDRWADHAHPEDRQRLAREWAAALARGTGFRCEYRLCHPDEATWVVGQILPETDLEGTVTGFVGAITDVTELRVARDRAEAADRAKSQFLANMNHELRTPIHTILGMAHFLRQAPLSPEHGRHLEVLESAGGALLRLVDIALDFSRIEAGKLILAEEEFAVADTVEQVRRLLGSKASEVGLDLQVSVAESVPRWVRGDAARLLQVLLSLVGNAIKFTPRGSVSLRIEHVPTGGLCFRIQDTGIGMSEEEASRIFEPFFQADDSMTRPFGGMGLGLTHSRRLVELMGGAIEVESTSPAGTTFVLTLPLAASAGPTPPASSEQTPEQTPPDRKGHILIVEDEPVSRLILRTLVEDLGHRVATANNGRKALEALERDSFDLVLMDCQMPEMDGYETTRRLRRAEEGTGRRLPIIAVTAHAGPGDRERCLAAGMDDYLTKPYRAEDLAAAIARRLVAPE